MGATAAFGLATCLVRPSLLPLGEVSGLGPGQLALGGPFRYRPTTTRARLDARHGALGPVQRRLDVVPHQQERHQHGHEQHDERPDGFKMLVSHPVTRSRGPAPGLGRRRPRVEPAKNTPGTGRPRARGRSGGQEDGRLLAEEEPAPGKSARRERTGTPRAPHQALRERRADEPEQVVEPVVPGSRKSSRWRQEVVVGRRVRHDGERGQVATARSRPRISASLAGKAAGLRRRPLFAAERWRPRLWGDGGRGTGAAGRGREPG